MKVKKMKAAVKKAPKAAQPAKGETKESKLVGLLLGKTAYTVKQIMDKTGFSMASAGMYISQSYLDRKNKPYKVVVSENGMQKTYRYEARKK